jgi:hypothetical protein
MRATNSTDSLVSRIQIIIVLCAWAGGLNVGHCADKGAVSPTTSLAAQANESGARVHPASPRDSNSEGALPNNDGPQSSGTTIVVPVPVKADGTTPLAIAPAVSSDSTSPGGSDGEGDNGGGTTGFQASDEIKKFIDDANKTRADFIKKQQELRGAMAGATREARDQIRNQLRQNREDFLNQQRDSRQDLRLKLATLRDQLKQHQDAIDDAKAEAKSRTAHARKDG